jgi:hypothetical protein
MVTSKVAMLISCMIVGFATVVTMAGNSHLPPGIVSWDQSAEVWTQDDAFSYPSKVLGVQDPDGSGFQAASGNPPTLTKPAGALEQILVGRPSNGRPSLVLPPGHAVELGFDGRIVDGPGPDILIAGWGCRHQQVILTDGARARFALPMAPCEGNKGQFGVLAIDLARFKVPFEIKAVRIQGYHYFTPTGFYRLTAVRARVLPPEAGGSRKE